MAKEREIIWLVKNSNRKQEKQLLRKECIATVLGILYQYTKQEIIGYLESIDTSHKSIYFDGCYGLGASAVLRAIVEDPPLSLRKKFNRIIHVDCSRWKSRRAMQREIVDNLKLPQWVMAIIDKQDEEDDFSGVDEGSRLEIERVGWEIQSSLRDHTCLVVFHNGSNDIIDIRDFGIPLFGLLGSTKVLWTFRGRLRLNPDLRSKVDDSHLCIYSYSLEWWEVVRAEAREIARYTHKIGVSTEIALECILYLLLLDDQRRRRGGDMDYNWSIHASNYWVCDGIIQRNHENEAWDVGTAMQLELRLEDDVRPEIPVEYITENMKEYYKLWTFVTTTSTEQRTVPPESTSCFISGCGSSQLSLPNRMFHQSGNLRVLKLCRCTFNFSSPPFSCCCTLRFLGLDRCKDQKEETEEKQGRAAAVEFFQSLLVLDICDTEWGLENKIVQMGTNIREINIKRGRVWHNNLAWRQLQNLRKLRVVEPTCSWETGQGDEFTGMVKLELLDLSGNSTIKVLPSLSGATSLKTLVLDGCVGLERVGPEGLPPSLETFSLDVGSNQKDAASKLSKISLVGCVHLQNFLLRGPLLALEELNLSGTSIRRVDLRDEVVQVTGLEKVFLTGCKQLRAILWWKEAMLQVLRIDTHGKNEDTGPPPPYSDSSSIRIQHKNYDGYIIASDVRIIQSLMIGSDNFIADSFYLDLHVPPSSSRSKGQSSSDEVMAKPRCYTYSDILLEGGAAPAYNHEIPWPPPSDCHVEVGEGISLSDVESNKGIRAIDDMMEWCINSLHMHDNSCILSITPKSAREGGYQSSKLKWCRVERCPKLQAVFSSYQMEFPELERIWASDLLAADCIWSKGTIYRYGDNFKRLQSIHVHNCPRLKFVLPFRGFTLPSLETLHISHCGDLRHVFPWDDNMYGKAGEVKEFAELRHIHLHDLPSLQEICEAKMSAPVLESVKVRGCWALRRLPAVGSHRPVVNCEKDCWEKLEWDGMHAGHDPSLYEPHHSSSYYKKRLIRGTVLR
ncbi:uncharacterized protein LOC133923382 [Phragmites australis]|uniref:uncharacterized protein LOC133923382 n=1 Tax=Phragmites australis TaxID=29695 RepID=UPI002D77581B|nr:uncharacterized protein LOC133923382 [Phragmites australis]